MGIINVTPDSFADGGVRFDAGRARLPTACSMVGRRRRHPRRRRRVDAARRRAAARGRGAAPRAARRRTAGASRAACPSRSTPTRRASPVRPLDRGAAIVNDISGLLYDDAPGRGGRGRRRGHRPDAHPRTLARHVRGGRLRRRDGEIAGELAPGHRAAPRRPASPARRSSSIPGSDSPSRPSTPARRIAAAGAPGVASDRPILVGPSRKSFLKSAIGDRPAAGARLGDRRGGHRLRPGRRAHRPRPRRARDGGCRPGRGSDSCRRHAERASAKAIPN